MDADESLDCTRILHDHCGAVCETCRKTTLDELNRLAAQVAQLRADNAVLAAEVRAGREKDRAPNGDDSEAWIQDSVRRVKAWVDAAYATDASGALARAKEGK